MIFFRGFPEVEDLKNQGNKLFKAKRYEEACNLYLDAIFEIEEIVEGNIVLRKNEDLKNLEISCRLNYCTSKIRLGYFFPYNFSLEISKLL